MSKQAKQAKQPTVKIGDFVRDAVIARRVLNDLKPSEIVAAAQSRFPGCKVNEFHVYWYASQLRSANL